MDKMKSLIILLIATNLANSQSVTELVKEIYNECLSDYSIACVKPRALSWLEEVSNRDEIKVTDNLSVVRTAVIENEGRAALDPELEIIDKVNDFLQTHAVKVKVPEEVSNSATAEFLPRTLLDDLPSELEMPLDGDEEIFEARRKKIRLPKPLRIKSKRGFIKKILLPFLLGLKFKASVLVPLALSMIALMTWKALTLGLISLVLSGAMVIFKFTKPKIVNYEVIHYPQHHVEHHVDHHDHHGWDHGPYKARSIDAQEMAYSAQM